MDPASTRHTALLLHGIGFADSDARAVEAALPPGVCGAPVRLVQSSGLGAAVSPVPVSVERAAHRIDARTDPLALPPAVLTVEAALAHGRVVDVMHRAGALIPLRFGCFLHDEAAVAAMLEHRAEEFCRMLHTVEGCVEMGVRILGTAHSLLPPTDGQPLASAARDGGRGTAYLSARRGVYAAVERQHGDAAAITDSLRTQLGGLFVQFRVEAGASRQEGTTLLASTYFLVERASLGAFRSAFRALVRRVERPLLLSGPWPPYNFVGPDDVSPPAHAPTTGA